MAYSGSVDLIAGIRPKNNGDFPLVNAADVYVEDGTPNGARLDAVLAGATGVSAYALSPACFPVQFTVGGDEFSIADNSGLQLSLTDEPTPRIALAPKTAPGGGAYSGGAVCWFNATTGVFVGLADGVTEPSFAGREPDVGSFPFIMFNVPSVRGVQVAAAADVAHKAEFAGLTLSDIATQQETREMVQKILGILKGTVVSVLLAAAMPLFGIDDNTRWEQVPPTNTVKSVVEQFAPTPDMPQPSDSVPLIAGSAAAGTSNEYARADHTHPAETEVAAYALSDDCFPITYEDSGFPAGQQSCTIASNDGIRFELNSTHNIVILHDIASEAAGGYEYGFSSFSASTLKWGSKDAPIENLKFNNIAPTANTWPVLEKDAVFVREVRMAKSSDISVTSVNSKTGAVLLSASDVGALPTTGGKMTGGLTVPNLTVGSRKSGSTVGVNSVAEGYSNTASGGYSRATGHNNTASGAYSRAEGFENTASASVSYAEGFATTADGVASHAEGHSTITKNRAEHAQGIFNNSHTGAAQSEITLSSIGFGAGDNVRKNAVETMQDGKTFIYGLGGYDGTNPTGTGVQDLAAAINVKAPLASPAFTGTPTAPDIGTNTTSQVATKNYVDFALAHAAPTNVASRQQYRLPAAFLPVTCSGAGGAAVTITNAADLVFEQAGEDMVSMGYVTDEEGMVPLGMFQPAPGSGRLVLVATLAADLAFAGEAPVAGSSPYLSQDAVSVLGVPVVNEGDLDAAVDLAVAPLPTKDYVRDEVSAAQLAMSDGFTTWDIRVLAPPVTGMPANAPLPEDLAVDRVSDVADGWSVFRASDTARTYATACGTVYTREDPVSLEWSEVNNTFGVVIQATRVRVPRMLDITGLSSTIRGNWTAVTNYIAWLENYATNNYAIAILANQRAKDIEFWQYTNSVTRADVENGATEWAVTPTWPVGRVVVRQITEGDDEGKWALFSPTATVYSAETALVAPQAAPDNATHLVWDDVEWHYTAGGSPASAVIDIDARRTLVIGASSVPIIGCTAQSVGAGADNANGSTIMFRPRYFGMRAGDRLRGITFVTRSNWSTEVPEIHARLRDAEADGYPILGISLASSLPGTGGTAVTFSFPNSVALPDETHRYFFDFTTTDSTSDADGQTDTGVTPLQLGLRTYSAVGASPDFFFQYNTLVPVFSVQYYTYAPEIPTSPANVSGTFALLSDIPTKVSALANDAGYLTQHQSLSGYATETWVGQQGYMTSYAESDPAAAGIASNVVTQAYIQEKLGVYLYIGQDGHCYVHVPEEE